IFLVNSGAEANENAIKLVRRSTGKPGILSFEGGFHGRTIGALSATGNEQYRMAFSPQVSDHHFVPFGDMDATSQCCAQHEIGGILLEPIQSMAGVRMAEDQFYRDLRQFCDQMQIKLIFDEVQTGFGRTGSFFFASEEDVLPDVVTLAKGMGSGFPIGGLLLSDDLAREIDYGDLGTTFGGGPLACAALEATISILQEQDLLEHVQKQSAYWCSAMQKLQGVEQVLGKGFLLGMRTIKPASWVQTKLREEHHILVGTSADPHVIRLLPPLTLQRAHIDLFIDACYEILGS
ncbi:MAG: aminotransferase class III-fold pyridoxal phosphate-dependent enzyme, partial [Myxococcota bacterium]